MRVYIFGCNGGMGRRYRAILEHLGHEWMGEDLSQDRKGSVDDADAVIVATPTPTHGQVLDRLLSCGKPILCEKPIMTDMEALRALLADAVISGTRLQMVSQYDYLIDPKSTGPSWYRYFKTGPDGLPWDCLQIIALAKDGCEVSDKSPVWDCGINGKRLDLRLMDQAYVAMIRDWLQAPRNDISRILEAHEKVIAWQQKS